MSPRYMPSHTAPESLTEPALWFVFAGADLLLCTAGEAHELPRCVDLAQHGLEGRRAQYLGRYDAIHCYAVEIEVAAALPEGWRAVGLREAFPLLGVELAALSGRAWQILDWDRNHQYCSRCGTPTQLRSDERSRICPGCRRTSYPPISPAVMVLITDGERRVLLARKPGWAPNRYSALAGFVEPGEMLEDTIVRETREEVGVEVTNIRYFGSQPWPFPHSLMIAFTAEYAGGEIRPDGVEIEDARWFEVDALPHLPPGISISRRLITTVAREMAGRRGGSSG